MAEQFCCALEPTLLTLSGPQAVWTKPVLSPLPSGDPQLVVGESGSRGRNQGGTARVRWSPALCRVAVGEREHREGRPEHGKLHAERPVSSVARWEDDQLSEWCGDADGAAVLPAHGAECLGCGPDNPAALHMKVVRIGDEVVTDLVLDRRHVGAPGLAHGGAVATACDDLFGFVLYLVGEAGVTRSLQVEYLTPTVLGRSYRIAARLDRREGRNLHMSAEGTGPDGRVAFTSSALFVVVSRRHFERFGPLTTNPGLNSMLSAGG